MIVSDIFPELQEVVGSESQDVCFNALTRGIELLANKGLYDPLQGTVDISVQNGWKIALPRDVKSPIRINIGGSPSFARSRLFEFAANTLGSVEGQENGLQWSDAGYSPIQDEGGLPGQLFYICINAGDTGASVTIYGRDQSGREITEKITAATTPSVLTTNSFYGIDYVTRDQTLGECQLFCRTETDNIIARYYGDETDPRYRVVKLSQTAQVVRVFYRKNVFRITSLSDIINLHSGLAVILAAKAARYYLQENWVAANGALAEATNIINEEQASRHELETVTPDVLTATNSNINTLDSIIVADIYDDACAIFGPIGREQIFDEMTTAIEILSNKAHWDAQLGVVDIWKSENFDVNPAGRSGNGYFVLPRYVDTIMSINWNGYPQMPRNRWFEFHLNGTGERPVSGFRKWDDLDTTVIVNGLPLDPDTRRVIPQKIVAIPDSSLDNDTVITVYGRDDTDRECVVTPPCVNGSLTPDSSQPLLTHIERIVKAPSTASIKLVCVNDDGSEGLLLGYWYPDELEPTYRRIKLQAAREARIRVMYRKRSAKITSLFDPIHLKSRLAIRTMMEAMSLRSKDIQSAMALEVLSLGYLRDEQAVTHPNKTVGLQFHSGSSPFLNWNVQ